MNLNSQYGQIIVPPYGLHDKICIYVVQWRADHASLELSRSRNFKNFISGNIWLVMRTKRVF